MFVCVCVRARARACIVVILMWDTQLVYEITNAMFIQLLVTHNRLLVNMYSGDELN